MKNYTVLRHAKLKTFGNIASSLSHLFRERKTENAIAEKKVLNIHKITTNVDDALAKYKERLKGIKIRKNAVLGLEYLMTASAEWFDNSTREQRNEFYKKSYVFLKEKYGHENIINFSVHNDETTPHVSAFVVPITKNGKLSARQFIGERKFLIQDQTDFALSVEHLGLKRGQRGSAAKHTTIKEFYDSIQADDIDITSENSQKIALMLKKKQFELEQNKANKKNLDAVHDHLVTLEREIFRGLTDENIEELSARADQMRIENEIQQQIVAEEQLKVTKAIEDKHTENNTVKRYRE